MKSELLKFIIVGVWNTIHYYAWYVILMQFVHWQYLTSHLVAMLISMVPSYFLNVYFTYKVSFKWKSFLLFPFTQLGNLIMQSSFMFVAVEWLHISPALSPLLVLGVTVPLTFLLTRRILYVSQNKRFV